MSNERVLLVDDNRGQRLTLESILKSAGFQVTSADCGQTALDEAGKQDFAVALLDIKMPDLTGIDVLKVLKKNRPQMSVIMMTGYAETEYAIEALNNGASAYLLKPANIEQIKILVREAIERQRLTEENQAMSLALREWAGKLESKVEDRTRQLIDAHKSTMHLYQELKKNFESTLEVLSIAIDQRDPLTASHSFRVTQYGIEIGRQMGLSEVDIEKLRYAGLMHDLGKIEIKEEILRKEGSLTTDEYREIQTHAHGTFALLSRFKFKRDLKDVPEIASSHHERFDGNGYPRKLSGENIPLLARVLAVADVLDAITSKRHYRNAMPIDNALGIIKREAGGHFDPACTAALFNVSVADFIKIHMADYLEHLEPADLIAFQPYTLEQLLAACASPNPAQMEMLQKFHRYYQGTAPAHLKGQLPECLHFDDDQDGAQAANC
jgi:response regulator RpfG family c-di-GMP phosphodiesterase